MSGFSGSRMNRQDAHKKLSKSKAELKRAERQNTELEALHRNVEIEIDWADREERYLERIRNGYSEGTKLYYDSFKTQATITTGCILVILALAGGVLPTNTDYIPILWVSCTLLLFSIIASLKTMEGVTTNVFTVLTNEDSPRVIRTRLAQERVDEEAEEDVKSGEEAAADEVKEQQKRQDKRLARRTKVASGSFLLGLATFVLYVVLPHLAELFGMAWAIVVSIVVAVLLGILYRRF